MGIPGQLDHPDYLAAVSRIVSAANKNEKLAGFMAVNKAVAEEYWGHGFRMIAYVIDHILLIAYTVWSKKKGGGKLIVKEVFKKIKKSNHLNRLVTLSPLTEMATKFHSKNGAKLLQVNEDTQNFEYKVLK